MKLHAILAIVATLEWLSPVLAQQVPSPNLTDNKAGGLAIHLAAVKVSTTYSVKPADQLVLADSTAAAFTVTLPAPKNGRLLTVENIGTAGYIVTVAADGSSTINGATTYTLPMQYQSVTLQALKTGTASLWHIVARTTGTGYASVTATTDGLTTGIIDPNASHLSVTSAGSTRIVKLPAPVVGKQLVLNVGANGFKLVTTSPTTIGINGGTGSSYFSAIAANSTCVLICVSATSWKGYFLDADSDVAKIPAAGP